MWDFVVKYWVEFAFGLVSAGLGLFCKHLLKERKRYKTYLEGEKEKKLDEHIDEKLEPVIAEIEQIRSYLMETQKEDSKKFSIIISSYRFKLCQLCKLYLNRGFMTSEEWECLNEFFKQYTELGGNGAAREWFEKTKNLPIHKDK